MLNSREIRAFCEKNGGSKASYVLNVLISGVNWSHSVGADALFAHSGLGFRIRLLSYRTFSRFDCVTELPEVVPVSKGCFFAGEALDTRVRGLSHTYKER